MTISTMILTSLAFIAVATLFNNRKEFVPLGHMSRVTYPVAAQAYTSTTHVLLPSSQGRERI